MYASTSIVAMDFNGVTPEPGNPVPEGYENCTELEDVDVIWFVHIPFPCQVMVSP